MNLGILGKLIAGRSSTAARPSQFFLARNSVPVLAYAGFSQTLLDIKRVIAEAIPDLKEENPGGLWPKTTLER